MSIWLLVANQQNTDILIDDSEHTVLIDKDMGHIQQPQTKSETIQLDKLINDKRYSELYKLLKNILSPGGKSSEQIALITIYCIKYILYLAAIFGLIINLLSLDSVKSKLYGWLFNIIDADKSNLIFDMKNALKATQQLRELLSNISENNDNLVDQLGNFIDICTKPPTYKNVTSYTKTEKDKITKNQEYQNMLLDYLHGVQQEIQQIHELRNILDSQTLEDLFENVFKQLNPIGHDKQYAELFVILINQIPRKEQHIKLDDNAELGDVNQYRNYMANEIYKLINSYMVLRHHEKLKHYYQQIMESIKNEAKFIQELVSPLVTSIYNSAGILYLDNKIEPTNKTGDKQNSHMNDLVNRYISPALCNPTNEQTDHLSVIRTKYGDMLREVRAQHERSVELVQQLEEYIDNLQKNQSANNNYDARLLPTLTTKLHDNIKDIYGKIDLENCIKYEDIYRIVLDDLTTKQTDYAIGKEALTTDIDTLKREIKTLKELIPEKKKYSAKRLERDKYQGEVNKIERENAILAQAILEYEEMITKRDQHTAQKTQLEEQLRRNQTELQQLRQEQLHDTRERIEGLTRDISMLESRIQEYQQQIDQYEQDIRAQKAISDKNRATIIKNNEEIQKYQDKIAQCNRICEEVRDKFIAKQTNVINDIESILKNVEDTLKTSQSRLNDYEKNIKENTRLLDDVKKNNNSKLHKIYHDTLIGIIQQELKDSRKKADKCKKYVTQFQTKQNEMTALIDKQENYLMNMYNILLIHTEMTQIYYTEIFKALDSVLSDYDYIASLKTIKKQYLPLMETMQITTLNEAVQLIHGIMTYHNYTQFRTFKSLVSQIYLENAIYVNDKDNTKLSDMVNHIKSITYIINKSKNNIAEDNKKFTFVLSDIAKNIGLIVMFFLVMSMVIVGINNFILIRAKSIENEVMVELVRICGLINLQQSKILEFKLSSVCESLINSLNQSVFYLITTKINYIVLTWFLPLIILCSLSILGILNLINYDMSPWILMIKALSIAAYIGISIIINYINDKIVKLNIAEQNINPDLLDDIAALSSEQSKNRWKLVCAKIIKGICIVFFIYNVIWPSITPYYNSEQGSITFKLKCGIDKNNKLLSYNPCALQLKNEKQDQNSKDYNLYMTQNRPNIWLIIMVVVAVITITVISIVRTKLNSSDELAQQGYSTYHSELEKIMNLKYDINIPNNNKNTINIEDHHIIKSIIVNNANPKYNVGDSAVINNMNMNIDMSDRILICGQSGSGKSTFVKYLLKLLGSPTERNTVILNVYDTHSNQYKQVDLADANFNMLLHHIPIIPQEPLLQNNLTVSDALSLIFPDLNKTNPNLVFYLSNVFELGDKIGREAVFKSLFNHISGGERQRVFLSFQIVKSLFMNKDYIEGLITDESYAKLHERLRRYFNILKNNLDVTLKLIMHDMFNIDPTIMHGVAQPLSNISLNNISKSSNTTSSLQAISLQPYNFIQADESGVISITHLPKEESGQMNPNALIDIEGGKAIHRDQYINLNKEQQ